MAQSKRKKKPFAQAKGLKKQSKKFEKESYPELSKIKDSFQDLLKTYDSFMRVQDSLTLVAIIVDNQANVISWNKTAERVTGYSREEVIGHSKAWEWLYPDPEYRKYIFELGTRIIQEGIVNRETIIVAKDGKKKNISWHSNMLINEHGEMKGIVALGADVTEQRNVEEQIRLKEKMDGMARLAGLIAHDFNNTFSIIQGYVELALEQMDYNDPTRGDLLEIVGAIEQGSALTSQLLAFSKRQIINPISLDLNLLIRQMSQVLKRTLGEQIEVVANLSEEIPTINADPNQIQQMILNLAVNAHEAMPKSGKFTISTSLSKIEYSRSRVQPFVEPGDYVLLSASDTGPGISPEVKEKIFEPFFTTKEGKLGFGLSTVYGIVNQHNGYIWIDSEPKKGTTFRIYLPISGKPAEFSRPKKPVLELPKGQESILLVEDNDQMRALAVRILRNLGYTVIETNNPKEALQILLQYPDPVHLLLTDVDLPLMTGAELAEQVLKIRPDLKTLYFSGYSIDYLVDKKMLKPGSPLLAKPFSMRSLSQKVREVLDQKK